MSFYFSGESRQESDKGGKMSQIRAAAVAGQFYPGKAEELAGSVDDLLAEADTSESCPKAIIAPHAGYIYSGPIAASIYARVRNAADTISRVILLGPSHRVGFNGIALSSADVYRTPLGDVAIDKASVQRLADLPNTGFLDEAHVPEHSLEVHLPFLQRTLGDFTLVPLVVGQAEPVDVARVLETLWGGEETLIVISSDLSHHEAYDMATAKDRATCKQIESLQTNISGDQACGCKPINGLLHLAKKKGLTVTTIDYRNSGDTAGPRNSVVGYGAYVITEPDQLPLAWRQQLLQLARSAIAHRLTTKEDFKIELSLYPEELKKQAASFVTLNLHGRLRGCIGSLVAHRQLPADIAHNAQAAAFQDPRFSAVTAAEFQHLDVHISILSEPSPMAVASREDLLQQIRPGIDGLIIEEGGARATYLPSVWEQITDPAVFIRELRSKAGLSPDGWSDATKVFRYTTREFS